MAITLTPNLGLKKQDFEDENWHVPLNETIDILDKKIGFFPELSKKISEIQPVDILIYNSTKDKDFGEWRYETSSTSWYNETLNTVTRGARKQFPSLSALVLENDKLTIYDLDTPECKMWMIFLAGTQHKLRDSVHCVDIKNGILLTGHQNGKGISIIDFKKDSSALMNVDLYSHERNILERNVDFSWELIKAGGGLNHGSINAISTKNINGELFIAVGTGDGISLIKEDLTVFDITWTTSKFIANVSIDNDNNILFTQGTNSENQFYVKKYQILQNDIAEGGGSLKGSAIEFYKKSKDLVGAADNSYLGKVLSVPMSLDKNIVGCISGITILNKKLVNYITTYYQSGFIPNNCYCFLSSIIDSPISSSSDIILNGVDFVGANGNTPPDNWYNTDNTFLYSVDNGELTIDRNGGGGTNTKQDILLEPLEQYSVVFSIIDNGGQAVTLIVDGNTFTKSNTGIFEVFFVAKNTNSTIEIRPSGSANQIIKIDYIKLKIMTSERSRYLQPILNIGTELKREKVNFSSELVWFNNFKGTSYFKQYHKSLLDFGTNDFCAMMWIKTKPVNNTSYIFSKEKTGTADNNTRILLYALENIDGITAQIGTTIIENTKKIDDNLPHLIVLKRVNGIASITIDDFEGTTISATADILPNSQVLKIGGRAVNGNSPWFGGISLFRIGQVTLTSEQINFIYNKEKELFENSCNCTLQSNDHEIKKIKDDLVCSQSGITEFDNLRTKIIPICEGDICLYSSDVPFISKTGSNYLFGTENGVIINQIELNYKELYLKLNSEILDIKKKIEEFHG